MTHHYTTTPHHQFLYCSCRQHLIRQCFGFVLPTYPDRDNYHDDDDDNKTNNNYNNKNNDKNNYRPGHCPML